MEWKTSEACLIGHLNSPKSREKRQNVVADFEATTKLDDCRVWGWGFAYVDYPDDVEIERTIEEFIERISYLNSTCYFHNLKYDGRFILDWLMKNGYTHDPDDGKNVREGDFKTLISDMGRFYSITVRWLNGNITEFRDSLNKIPLPIARIATAFKLGESKGDLDYHADRPVGHVITAEEKDYIRRDVSILAKAMKEILEAGMVKLTVASDSMAQYKSSVGKHFPNFFPILPEEMDTEIRRAYRGGFTYADPRFHKRRLGSGIVLDVNSLYPSVMKNSPIPYGEPLWEDGEVATDTRHPVSIFSITFTARLRPGHIPCIQIKGSSMFTPTEYLSVIDEPTTLMMTNIDFALYSEHYDMNIIEYGGGWKFQAAVGMFNAYIEKWAKVKEESVGGQREIAKLFLNSLYGKFATNPHVASKVPVLKDDVVRLVQGEDATRSPVYTAAGVFITSYARDLTIRAAQANYGVFAYADTDSLHLLQNEIPESIDIHPTRMGAWKFEYAFDSAFYVRAKAYLERHAEWCSCKECGFSDGEVFTNRIAGLPERISSLLRFDDLVDGKVLHGKLTPKAVSGGIVLVDTPYQLKL